MAESITRPSYEKVERKVEVMDTPYDRWISSQGVDVVRGFFVEDLYTIPLKPWDRVGGYRRLHHARWNRLSRRCLRGRDSSGQEPQAAAPHLRSALLRARRPRRDHGIGRATAPSRASNGRPEVCLRFRSTLPYQHFNGQGDRRRACSRSRRRRWFSICFTAKTSSINNPYAFTDRFKGEDGYFAGSGKLYSDRVVETNFVADAINIEPVAWTERGKGQRDDLLRNVGEHDGLPRFPLPRWRLQEGTPARSRRACFHPYREGLFAALARGKKDDPRRLEARLDRRAARRLVSPAL